jgi:hypothetical protein
MKQSTSGALAIFGNAESCESFAAFQTVKLHECSCHRSPTTHVASDLNIDPLSSITPSTTYHCSIAATRWHLSTPPPLVAILRSQPLAQDICINVYGCQKIRAILV